MGRSGSSSASVCGPKEEVEKTSVGCFFSFGFGVKERFWNRLHNTKKSVKVKSEIFLLPDDILEMCLDRVSFESLKNARLVCKKWSSLITIAKVRQKKKESRYQNLWFFVFGTVCYNIQYPTSYSDVNIIHALDLSCNQWHSIDANFLQGRYWFSVASIHGGVFIVGGRTQSSNLAGRGIAHKEVMFFNPVSKSWHNMPSMKYARYLPVVGVTEDPIIPYTRSSYTIKAYIRQRRSDHSTSSSKGIKKSFLLIAVGGGNNDSWCSGEIYDSLTNKWTEIQRLPLDFGIALSGTVCGSMFYLLCPGNGGNEKLAAYDIEKGFWIAIQTNPPFLPELNAYRTHLVSSNGRLYMISRCTWYAHDSIVRKLWELDLMNMTWTEILVHPDAPINGESEVFVADQNLIFGLEKLEGSGQILDYLSVCDVSESNNAKWNNISTKYVAPKCGVDPFWDRSVAVVHANI